MPKTDDDVLRELLHRATDDLHAPSAVTAGIVARHHRQLRNTRILSITTTSVAAAAVVAAVVVTRVEPSAPSHAQQPAALPATELPPVKLTAVQVLDQLSVAAGRARQPTGRYIALAEIDQPEGLERTTVFDGLTGDVWSYQHVAPGYQYGSDAPSESPVAKHWSPTRAEFATWPTNPVKLRALLISQGAQAGADDEEGVQSEVINGATTDDLVFQEATDWLWNPLLSPALRAAMYKVLAATPGVTVKTGTTDKTGRPAIEISRRDSDARYTTFESPSTGAVLEQDFDLAGTAVYTAVTGYATSPANPYSGG
jgi:hypothetical protein